MMSRCVNGVSRCVSCCLAVARGVASRGVSWCNVSLCFVVWCLVVSCGLSWCLAMSYGVLWCLVVLVVFCGVSLCSVVSRGLAARGVS